MNLSILDPEPDSLITTSRHIAAPIEVVFRAWSEPEHLKNWWGPNGFTNTFHEFEFKRGGKWEFTMHGPEKGNFENACVFVEIEEPFRIVLNHITQPWFQIEAILTREPENETVICFMQKFRTKEECDKVRVFATGKNEENMDRLEEEVSNMMKER